MEELASELLKELNCDTAFSIKLPAGLPLIGGVQLDIAESVVITWVVMAVILILLSASGCLATASAALLVAIPIPIPAPIHASAAIPAPIAIIMNPPSFKKSVVSE